MKLSEIRIPKRHRKDLGDIQSLADSMSHLGLLQPIAILEDGTLLAGERRIAAAKFLEWHTIPHITIKTVDDALKALQAERDENTERKPFAPSEAVALGRDIEAIEAKAAKERQTAGKSMDGKAGGRGKKKNLVENFHKVSGGGKTRDRVGAAVGLSGKTYQKAHAIVKAAEAQPDLYGDLASRMDKSGKVDPAYREYNRRKKRSEMQQLAERITQQGNLYCLIHGDIETAEIDPESVDAIITDPPYPEEYLPLYEILADRAAKWLKPNGILAVMVGQSYLPQIIRLMTPHIPYRWICAYLTPGPSTKVWKPSVNTSWKPVILFAKQGAVNQWITDIFMSDRQDKRFDDWGQSEGGMMQVVNRLSHPGDLILDPFCGGGTTGVVSVRLGRRFIGIDKDQEAINTSAVRLNHATSQA